MNTVRTPHEQTAYDMGVEAAKNAASWIVDGNTKTEFIPAVLALMDAGDPEAYAYLPAMPDLSGQWADDPTPMSLYRDITGNDPDDADGMDALCDAYEAGVSDTFEAECERILRAAIA